ncbi:hypothetical protein [Actinomadura bangladeshensis]|uniref:Uncharacterized protein n=1 Tax=Actinomadura bangladeshensis TaxID=453573 RepID=A0A6L9QMW4_9ACTN|nr:hypothetical protein [Actinomadura bangladeshensis]NEA26879.1 hypothetical protein [Actinomadura bangladeshensis]
MDETRHGRAAGRRRPLRADAAGAVRCSAVIAFPAPAAGRPGVPGGTGDPGGAGAARCGDDVHEPGVREGAGARA